MSDLFSATYNPDVLSCLANLSNDEVFTPPEVVNQMLDMLPEEIWSDRNATFLDPACKTGVFLREIAKRLIEAQLPNYEQISYEINEKLRAGCELDGRDIAFQKMLEDVIEHVFRNQVFGIAITELTSLLSRRSVYCSKYPQSEYSVVRFDNPEGRIDYKQMQHTWKNGKCIYCGASEGEYDREEGKEQYAYEFIHLDNPEEVFDMKFDVIIGNPPYHMKTGGSGSQAKPVYQLFFNQAKKLNPRYLAMIIPSRWFAGGMGLEEFRNEMMNDAHILEMVEYANAKDCFPQNSISGGVCYFLWNRDKTELCKFTNRSNASGDATLFRALNEFPILVRYNKAIQILRKVNAEENESLTEIVSSISPFGLPTKFRGSNKNKGGIRVLSSAGFSFVHKKEVNTDNPYLRKYKVAISQTGAEHACEPDKSGMFRVLTSSMQVLNPMDVCTHSYIVAGQFETKEEAANLLSYLQTKFARFLVLQAVSSIHISKQTFCMVPLQDFSKPWTDEELYEKYGITEEEQAFIDSLIKPMELGD